MGNGRGGWWWVGGVGGVVSSTRTWTHDCSEMEIPQSEPTRISASTSPRRAVWKAHRRLGLLAPSKFLRMPRLGEATTAAVEYAQH